MEQREGSRKEDKRKEEQFLTGKMTKKKEKDTQKKK
jgi:hypothetical protein